MIENIICIYKDQNKIEETFKIINPYCNSIEFVDIKNILELKNLQLTSKKIENYELRIKNNIEIILKKAYSVLQKRCFIDFTLYETEDSELCESEFVENAPQFISKLKENQEINKKCFLGYFDGLHYKFFEGKLNGIIKKKENKIDDKFTFDEKIESFFYPDSYPFSLKEMKDFKFIFSERKKALLKLFKEIRNDFFCDYLSKMKNKENNEPQNKLNQNEQNKINLIKKLPQYKEYKGIFEIHITTVFEYTNDKEKDSKIESFKKICIENKFKPVLILLENQNGENTNLSPQMMTSSYHCYTSLFEIQKKSFSIAKIFAKKGFKIVRTKCESIFSNEGIPEVEESANLFHCPLNYFEFHFKIFFPKENLDFLLQKVVKICKENDLHLSKNAFKKSEKGEMKFVTCRIYKKGKDFANSRFQFFLDLLKQEELQIESSLKEYSIYDSNVQLDKGWIN